MTNEELADLITARTANLRDHFDAKIESRISALEERFDLKLAAMQAHIYGKLLSMESDMLDLRADVVRLREAVNAQAKALEERG